MKLKKVFILAVTLVLSFASFAMEEARELSLSETLKLELDANYRWFQVSANVNVGSYKVSANVFNSSYTNMFCKVKSIGQYPNGYTTYSWSRGWIGYGGYVYSYVTSGRGNYFVAGDARAYCHY